jgi:hypothetical protein
VSVPGDLRPGRPIGGADAPRRGPTEAPSRRPLAGLLAALGIGALAALAWSILRGILELSVGLLVVSTLGGWGIGAALRASLPSRVLAIGLGVGAWLLSLVLTWVVTRVTLLSDRPLGERLAQTPFIDFTIQQLGLLELVSLGLFVSAALYGVTRTPRAS